MPDVRALLARCVEAGGSDLHLKTDTGSVYLRKHGELYHWDDVASYDTAAFQSSMNELLRPDQIKKFEDTQELDFSLEIKTVARFRGNMYWQRGFPQAVFRVIPYHISTMEELQLPQACFDFIDRPRGLVLVTGPAGSGKSTTLAAMIDKINRSQTCHIITVEDPTEFVHDDHVALINQRELDVDTLSFANALKYVLRQDPDVILVGEMRDLETIETALVAAETGHLVLSTLHTLDASETIARIISVFPPFQQKSIRIQLAGLLKAIVSQRLMKEAKGKGRVPAVEVLVSTPLIRDYILHEEKTNQVRDAISAGTSQYGMQTFDQSLFYLYQSGLITLEEALRGSTNPDEFRLRLAGIQNTTTIAREDMERQSGVGKVGDLISRI
jgi:twitching motility protein PilT